MIELNYRALWNSYMRAAEKARRSKDFLKAKRILLYAMNEAEEFQEVDPRLIVCIRDLAELFCSDGRFAEAKCLYSAVLEIREKLPGADGTEVADSRERKGLTLA